MAWHAIICRHRGGVFQSAHGLRCIILLGEAPWLPLIVASGHSLPCSLVHHSPAASAHTTVRPHDLRPPISPCTKMTPVPHAIHVAMHKELGQPRGFELAHNMVSRASWLS